MRKAQQLAHFYRVYDASAVAAASKLPRFRNDPLSLAAPIPRITDYHGGVDPTGLWPAHLLTRYCFGWRPVRSVCALEAAANDVNLWDTDPGRGCR